MPCQEQLTKHGLDAESFVDEGEYEVDMNVKTITTKYACNKYISQRRGSQQYHSCY